MFRNNVLRHLYRRRVNNFNTKSNDTDYKRIKCRAVSFTNLISKGATNRTTFSLLSRRWNVSRSFSSTSLNSTSDTSSNVSAEVINAVDVATSVQPELMWYYPSHWVMEAVHSLHEVSGCSYSVSMAALTVAFRIVLFPMALRIRRRRYHIENSLVNEDDNKKTLLSSYRSDVKRRKQGRSMMSTNERLFPLVNVVSMVTMLYSLGSMTRYFPTEMASGGILWFTDLAQPDPICFLPIVCWCTFFIMGEMGADMFGNIEKQSSTLKRNLFRTFYVIIFVPLMFSPSAVFCYWIPNHLFSMGQIILFTDPTCMKYLGIVEPSSSSIFPRNKPSVVIPIIQMQQTNTKKLSIGKRSHRKKRR